MEKCSKCGTKLENFFEYCPECGLKINRRAGVKEKKEISSNVYAYDEAKMKQYGICNKQKFYKGVVIGLILILIGLGLIFVGGAIFTIVLVPTGFIFIFTSNKYGKYNYFIKQCKKIKEGMNIHQVRALLAFIEPINEGFDRRGDYVIVYNTSLGKRKDSDYEGLTVTFDEFANVIDIGRSYQRTTTTYC